MEKTSASLVKTKTAHNAATRQEYALDANLYIRWTVQTTNNATTLDPNEVVDYHNPDIERTVRHRLREQGLV